MDTEQRIASHYTLGVLGQSILETLRAVGKDPDRLTPEDLASGEEFHVGGRTATADLAAQMELREGMHLLDIGSGIGGSARFMAHTFGCRVTGVDLTEEFVEVAGDLSRRVGLDSKVSFRQGSALALPFPAESFDGAYMLHVGMNISDKSALFAEVRRVLRPGAVFGVYDVMRYGDGSLDFPLPWSSVAETSFVARPADYRDALKTAGFTIDAERNRREFALQRLRASLASVDEATGPVFTSHLFMGSEFRQKIANIMAAVDRGLVAPTEIIARRT